MPRLIIYIVKPDALPKEGEFTPLSYWLRNSYDVDEFFLNGPTKVTLIRNDIEARAQSGVLIALPRPLEADGSRTLLCNSRGEVIYANRKNPNSDWDYIMTIRR